MATYSVVIVRSAEKEIAGLPGPIRKRVVRRILALADDPRPPGCVKLSGDDKYRVRQGVRQGNRRIVYTIADAVVTVTVVRVAHRSDVYR